jgi:hypothetical protein
LPLHITAQGIGLFYFTTKYPSSFSAAKKFRTQTAPILKLLRMIGIPTAAFYQLSPEYIESEFNPFVKDSPNVLYFSMSGGAGKRPVPPYSLMRLYYHYLKKKEGPNDGLVSIKSAMWGTFLGALEIDHMDVMNWNIFRDTRYIYRNICHLLSEKEKGSGIQ